MILKKISLHEEDEDETDILANKNTSNKSSSSIKEDIKGS